MSQPPNQEFDKITRLPAVGGLTELTFVEQLCLWSIRIWADHFRKGTHPQSLIRDAYRLAGAPGAMADMDAFMSILVAGLYQPVDVRCLNCPGISEEEFLMMEALALSQRNMDQMAEIALESLMRPAALRTALPILSSWSGTLTKASHKIPFRQWVPKISDPASLHRSESEFQAMSKSNHHSLH